MLKGILCYYSGSGNTQLMCEFLAKQLTNAEFELVDMVKQPTPDFSKYAVAGFATFTDFGTVSEYVRRFFDSMPAQSHLPAFALVTYGAMPGLALYDLATLAEGKGFRVLNGHGLRMPENYPPMRKRGMTADDAPAPQNLDPFRAFAQRLDRQLAALADGQTPEPEPIKAGLLARLMAKIPIPKGKKDMKEQAVDESKCTACGICAKRCPYGAITLQPKPVFDHQKCFACWACYNHCPEQAIFTPKIGAGFQYAKPNEAVRQKLL